MALSLANAMADCSRFLDILTLGCETARVSGSRLDMLAGEAATVRAPL